MTGITDPSQEYFKDGLWAWVTDQWKKLIGDAAGHLQVDVVESGLPTGAATSANQTTMITALQLIDDLRGALNSIHTDELDVVIDGQNADVEVKQQTAADLTPGIMGWDGTAWHKLPMVWGYSDRWAESVDDTASGAYDAQAVTADVPAGHVYVGERMSIYHDAAAAKEVAIYLYDGAAGYHVYHNTAVAPGTHIPLILEVTLRAGDSVRAAITSPGDGKKIYLRCWGYKMKVAE